MIFMLIFNPTVSVVTIEDSPTLTGNVDSDTGRIV